MRLLITAEELFNIWLTIALDDLQKVGFYQDCKNRVTFRGEKKLGQPHLFPKRLTWFEFLVGNENKCWSSV
jgi:hypothetical protein